MSHDVTFDGDAFALHIDHPDLGEVMVEYTESNALIVTIGGVDRIGIGLNDTAEGDPTVIIWNNDDDENVVCTLHLGGIDFNQDPFTCAIQLGVSP